MREAKGTVRAKQRQDQRHKEREGEVDSPGKILTGAASAALARALPEQLARRQQSMPPLSPRVPTPPTNYIGTKAREAPLWWHADLRQDHKHTRSDEDQKTTTPGKTLAGDDHGAPARPLPRLWRLPR